MGSRYNRPGEAVLTSTHNQCFGSRIRKSDIPCIPQFNYIKLGFNGVFILGTCFPDAQYLFQSASACKLFADALKRVLTGNIDQL